MKKVVYGVLLITIFGLAACGNGKKETSSSSKVDQLESRVKNLESSSSAEVEESKQDREEMLVNLKSETNKKIASTFLDNNLGMYNAQTDGPSEMQPVPEDNPTNRPVYSSGMSFYVEDTEDSFIVYVENYTSVEEVDAANKFLTENAVDQPLMSDNNSTFSIMYAYPRISSKSTKEKDEKDFNKYKEVFENIQ
ncbi:hypothetical protein [Enterococcus wangshanyuanii]|uniref:Lipoprotein n=1 Tax=Enterococcus wangshanyuanii TaxID=2005703 RepID=A0ABQ1PU36_9ENTE|nr:hypothetical protein [Enterococcus wangshanyuanii]GGD03801.1 hypothetical protein GCM10011573_36610 [Enterococcus wangshanyuanii]